MDNVYSYRLEQFEGPLDLLLSLIRKHKIDIYDIPIALLCDQYFAYIEAAKEAQMELASEFLVMASELMLIKSRMLLPRQAPDAPDPRAELSDALYRYAEAKAAAVLLTALYSQYRGRMEKETDEISPDRSFVADQDPGKLPALIHRLNALVGHSDFDRMNPAFAPLIKRPMIPVEVKISGIVNHISDKGKATLRDLLADEPTLPDLVASFMGVLELLKLRRILIDETQDGTDGENSVHGASTRFLLNPDPLPTGETVFFPGETDITPERSSSV